MKKTVQKTEDKGVAALALTALQASFSVGFKLQLDKFEPIDVHISKSRSLKVGEKEEELVSHIADEVVEAMEPEVRKAVAAIQGIKERIYEECSDTE